MWSISRFRFRSFRLALSVLIALGLAVVVVAAPASADTGDGADAASEDSFYTPPIGYGNTAPGTVLKSRPVVIKQLELFPLRVQSWQLLYRTTDSDGNPYASVTTVMIPDGPAKARPLLSYQMAYNAIQRECMPSYSLVHANPLNLLEPAPNAAWALPPMEITLALAGLEKGWAVALPDAGGIDNHFLTPRVMGYTTLDGIRAAKNFAPLGLPGADTRTALWGYSTGGNTSQWAVELQPDYAPELHIAGAALGAPDPDLDAALRAVDGRLLAGIIPLGMAGIAKDSSDAAARLDHFLNPSGKAIVAAAGAHCFDKVTLTNMFRRADSLLNAPLDQVLDDPIIHRAIEARNRPTTSTPQAPLYIYNAVNDEVSTIGAADAMVRNYCSHGASVTYTRDNMPDTFSNHVIVALTGAGGAFAWLTKALSDDQPVQPPGCTTTTVSTAAIDPAGLATLPTFVAATIKTFLGQPLGAGQ